MALKLYKVYCGKNGKYYTYKNLSQAESLFYKLSNQNYHTSLIEIDSCGLRVLKEYI